LAAKHAGGIRMRRSKKCFYEGLAEKRVFGEKSRKTTNKKIDRRS